MKFLNWLFGKKPPKEILFDYDAQIERLLGYKDGDKIYAEWANAIGIFAFLLAGPEPGTRSLSGCPLMIKTGNSIASVNGKEIKSFRAIKTDEGIPNSTKELLSAPEKYLSTFKKYQEEFDKYVPGRRRELQIFYENWASR